MHLMATPAESLQSFDLWPIVNSFVDESTIIYSELEQVMGHFK